MKSCDFSHSMKSSKLNIDKLPHMIHQNARIDTSKHNLQLKYWNIEFWRDSIILDCFRCSIFSTFSHSGHSNSKMRIGFGTLWYIVVKLRLVAIRKKIYARSGLLEKKSYELWKLNNPSKTHQNQNFSIKLSFFWLTTGIKVVALN